MIQRKISSDLEKWAIRFCALAFVSGIYLTVSADEKDKHDFKRAITASSCAILGGVGVGMANWRLFNRGKE